MGGVFLSYAREDADYARELRSGLEAAGIKVWFDQDSLRSGDSFHPKIEQCITRDCSCFIAIVSRTTEQRHEGTLDASGTLQSSEIREYIIRSVLSCQW